MVAVVGTPLVGTSAGWLQLRDLWETSLGTAGTLVNWFDVANSRRSYFNDFVLR
jgi:hypothetical protein